MLQIGEVAKRSGIGVETVRFYEREGLIPIAERSASGYRRYPESVVKKLLFIQHAKTLGFSLKEIGELILLRNSPNADCSGIKSRAIAKMAEIQSKIDALEKMKAALQPLISQCESNSSVNECPILNALDDEILNN